MIKTTFALMVLSLLAAITPASAASCDDPRPLRFALSPISKPEIRRLQYRPLIQHLEKALERRVEILPAPSYGSVIEGLLAGGVDLAELGPASYAIALSRGARITAFATLSQLTSPLTESSSTYRSLLIVRRDSGLNQLESLRGKSLSLTDPASTSGAILPRQAISRLTGMPLETYFQRITFAGSHDRAIEAIQKVLVDAAFVSSSRLDEALRRGSLRPGETTILWQSPPIPYDPIVLRESLCPALAAKIRQVFLGDTRLLSGMFRELNVSGFAPASDDQYREVRELFNGQ